MARLCEMLCEAESQHAQVDNTEGGEGQEIRWSIKTETAV